MAIILNFPEKGKDRYIATCPKCESTAWVILVDGMEVTKLLAFECSVCHYHIPVNIYFKIKSEE